MVRGGDFALRIDPVCNMLGFRGFAGGTNFGMLACNSHEFPYIHETQVFSVPTCSNVHSLSRHVT